MSVAGERRGGWVQRQGVPGADLAEPDGAFLHLDVPSPLAHELQNRVPRHACNRSKGPPQGHPSQHGEGKAVTLTSTLTIGVAVTVPVTMTSTLTNGVTVTVTVTVPVTSDRDSLPM